MTFLDTRITQRSLANKSLLGLTANQARLGRLQEQMSSGKTISRPSDNPGGTVSALQLRAEIQRNEQYGRNAQDGLGWLGTIDNTLTSMSDQLRRVRDLTLQGMNTGSSSAEARQALASEVLAIRDSLISAANTTYIDRPVFGGTTGGAVAYDATGVYVGDAHAVARTVGPNSTVRVDITGPETFTDPSLPAGETLFTVLTSIATDLTGTTSNLGGDLGKLDVISKNMVTKLADVGSRYKRIEQAQSSSESRTLDLQKTLGGIEDVDLPKILMEISLQSATYQAALNATSKTVQPSLMDYLR